MRSCVCVVMIIAWPAFVVGAGDQKRVCEFVQKLVELAPLTGGDPVVLRINMGIVRGFIEVRSTRLGSMSYAVFCFAEVSFCICLCGSTGKYVCEWRQRGVAPFV